MTVLAWLMIFTGITLIAATVKGQTFDDNGRFVLLENLQTLFEAFIRGDAATVNRISSASGGGYGDTVKSDLSGEVISQGAAPANGQYRLGAVKPHVAEAANIIGPMFGIRTIYGFASKPGYHGIGQALDFMCTREQGDKIVAYAMANQYTLGVIEIIWWKRIWTRARAAEGWRSYSGASDHTDHVHLSFNATGGV